MASNVYLVVEPMAVVAEDLALCIGEGDPGAEVRTASDEAGALEALVGAARIRAAFWHGDPARLAAGPLATALAARGAAVVFMGDAAEQAAGPGIVLERPFSPATVAAVLARLP